MMSTSQASSTMSGVSISFMNRIMIIIQALFNNISLVSLSLWDIAVPMAPGAWLFLGNVFSLIYNNLVILCMLLMQLFIWLWAYTCSKSSVTWEYTCSVYSWTWTHTCTISSQTWVRSCAVSESLRIYTHKTFRVIWRHSSPIASRALVHLPWFWKHVVLISSWSWRHISSVAPFVWEYVCAMAYSTWEQICITAYWIWQKSGIISKFIWSYLGPVYRLVRHHAETTTIRVREVVCTVSSIAVDNIYANSIRTQEFMHVLTIWMKENGHLISKWISKNMSEFAIWAWEHIQVISIWTWTHTRTVLIWAYDNLYSISSWMYDQKETMYKCTCDIAHHAWLHICSMSLIARDKACVVSSVVWPYISTSSLKVWNTASELSVMSWEHTKQFSTRARQNMSSSSSLAWKHTYSNSIWAWDHTCTISHNMKDRTVTISTVTWLHISSVSHVAWKHSCTISAGAYESLSDSWEPMWAANEEFGIYVQTINCHCWSSVEVVVDWIAAQSGLSWESIDTTLIQILKRASTGCNILIVSLIKLLNILLIKLKTLVDISCIYLYQSYCWSSDYISRYGLREYFKELSKHTVQLCLKCVIFISICAGPFYLPFSATISIFISGLSYSMICSTISDDIQNRMGLFQTQFEKTMLISNMNGQIITHVSTKITETKPTIPVLPML